MPSRFTRVWITGGSSGIGLALARAYSEAGSEVIISARDPERLGEAARATGSTPLPLDVTDREAVRDAVAQIWETHGSVDLAILNAGASFPRKPDDTYENLARHLEVNLLGVAAAVDALRPRMRESGGGTIAVVASLAGYLGLPGTVGYGTSKAALIYYTEALWHELQKEGIDLHLINPGFVQTPLVAGNRLPKPFMLSPREAARRIVQGLEAGSFEIAFPRRLAWPLRLLRAFPSRIRLWLFSRALALWVK